MEGSEGSKRSEMDIYYEEMTRFFVLLYETVRENQPWCARVKNRENCKRSYVLLNGKSWLRSKDAPFGARRLIFVSSL